MKTIQELTSTELQDLLLKAKTYFANLSTEEKEEIFQREERAIQHLKKMRQVNPEILRRPIDR